MSTIPALFQYPQRVESPQAPDLLDDSRPVTREGSCSHLWSLGVAGVLRCHWCAIRYTDVLRKSPGKTTPATQTHDHQASEE